MKILLIGEFSGVHNNLKKGLTDLGHDVKLAAEGDGYRKFDYDFRIAPYKGEILGRILNLSYFIFNIRKFIGYDIVQFIFPFSIPYYYHYIGLIKILFSFNKKICYYACGTDPNFLKAKKHFKYFPFDNKNKEEFSHFKNNLLKKNYYKYFISNIDCIIPSMYTYYIGHKENNKLSNPIPLPGSCEVSNVKKKISGSKVKILHGITRPGFKGSEYILKALDLIKKKYKNRVEIVIAEGLSFVDYNNYLKNADIVIDQCKSYDYGMNTIFALEKNCIVLSGAEQVAMDYLGFQDCPVINILPDVDDIFTKLDGILNLNILSIDNLKMQSFNFVQNNHSVSKSALKFSKIYKSL